MTETELSCLEIMLLYSQGGAGPWVAIIMIYGPRCKHNILYMNEITMTNWDSMTIVQETSAQNTHCS